MTFSLVTVEWIRALSLGWNETFGYRQTERTPPLGAAGPVRSRSTPYAGGLLPDRFPAQVPTVVSSARTVYQKVWLVFCAAVGAPAPSST